MTIDEIIAYIMHTPENTNPAVLRDQLNSIAPSGDSSSALPSDLAIINIDVTEDNTVVLQQGNDELEM